VARFVQSQELWVVHGHHVFPVDPRMPGLNGYSGGWPRGAMSGGLTWAVVSMDDASCVPFLPPAKQRRPCPIALHIQPPYDSH
jgi:hypothetical protein